MRIIILGVLIVILNACLPPARVWYKADASSENLRTDEAQCRYEAELASPPIGNYFAPTLPHWHYFDWSFYRSSKKDKDRDEYLRHLAREAVRDARRQAYYDRNYHVRYLINLCMEARGWQLLPVETLATKTK